MKRKPWPILILALLHLLAPLGNIVFNSLRAGRSFSQTWDYWLNIPKPLFLAYVVIPPLAGIFIYICRRWSYWCYVGCLGLIFIANAYGFWTSMNWMNFLTLVLMLVVDILAVAYFVVPSVRKLYFDPRIRWWETAPRYVFNTPGTISGVLGTIRNISEGGAMVEMGAGCPNGQTVELVWSFDSQSYAVSGRVVYCRAVGDRTACGVRFEHTPQTQKGMNSLIQKLDREGKKIRDREPGPEDSFGNWLKNLFATREGLFPK